MLDKEKKVSLINGIVEMEIHMQNNKIESLSYSKHKN